MRYWIVGIAVAALAFSAAFAQNTQATCDAENALVAQPVY